MKKFSAALLFVLLASYSLPAKHLTVSEPDSSEAIIPNNDQEAQITEANWQRDPKIVAIRRIVDSSNAGLKKGIFKTGQRKFEYCGDHQYFTLRRIARDPRGSVTWFEEYSEGEDESWDSHSYYDTLSDYVLS
jgi:hypothetical protein